MTCSFSGMQTNDLKTSIEDTLISALYRMGKIEFSNVYKPAKFDWERCSRRLLRVIVLCTGTDKGVSAMKIVVSGKLLDYDDEFLASFRNPVAVQALHQCLPKDIRVFSCMVLGGSRTVDTRISNGFNPHLNSYSRFYSYYLPLSTLRGSVAFRS